jgi:2-C-methyl-D-erythritol 4-phosphate cytidylyltransferase
MKNKSDINVIILAAGLSKRAGKDKQFFRIGKRFLVDITLSKFLNIDDVTKIILVLSKKNIKKYSNFFKSRKITVTEGGATRLESLLKASACVDRDCDAVMIHDGARPFVSARLIKKIATDTIRYGCVVPVVPLKDTVKKLSDNRKKVIETIDRKKHYTVQTPQSYSKKFFDILIENINDMDVTDDSQIIEKLGFDVHSVEGEDSNIKVTTPLDLKIAKIIYEETNKK